MDIVERLRTETPSYVLIGDAAIEIERLRELLGDVLIMSSEDIPYWLQMDIRSALQQKESE